MLLNSWLKTICDSLPQIFRIYHQEYETKRLEATNILNFSRGIDKKRLECAGITCTSIHTSIPIGYTTHGTCKIAQIGIQKLLHLCGKLNVSVDVPIMQIGMRLKEAAKAVMLKNRNFLSDQERLTIECITGEIAFYHELISKYNRPTLSRIVNESQRDLIDIATSLDLTYIARPDNIFWASVPKHIFTGAIGNCDMPHLGITINSTENSSLHSSLIDAWKIENDKMTSTTGPNSILVKEACIFFKTLSSETVNETVTSLYYHLWRQARDLSNYIEFVAKRQPNSNTILDSLDELLNNQLSNFKDYCRNIFSTFAATIEIETKSTANSQASQQASQGSAFIDPLDENLKQIIQNLADKQKDIYLSREILEWKKHQEKILEFVKKYVYIFDLSSSQGNEGNKKGEKNTLHSWISFLTKTLGLISNDMINKLEMNATSGLSFKELNEKRTRIWTDKFQHWKNKMTHFIFQHLKNEDRVFVPYGQPDRKDSMEIQDFEKLVNKSLDWIKKEFHSNQKGENILVEKYIQQSKYIEQVSFFSSGKIRYQEAVDRFRGVSQDLHGPLSNLDLVKRGFDPHHPTIDLTGSRIVSDLDIESESESEPEPETKASESDAESYFIKNMQTSNTSLSKTPENTIESKKRKRNGLGEDYTNENNQEKKQRINANATSYEKKYVKFYPNPSTLSIETHVSVESELMAIVSQNHPLNIQLLTVSCSIFTHESMVPILSNLDRCSTYIKTCNARLVEDDITAPDYVKTAFGIVSRQFGMYVSLHDLLLWLSSATIWVSWFSTL